MDEIATLERDLLAMASLVGESPEAELISLERRSQNPDLSTHVKDYPLQGSLMLFPIHSTISPYLLGGIGWYTHVVEALSAGKVTATAASRTAGYHAGFGAEVKIGGHAGVHADYRYTMLHFGGGTDAGTGGLASRIKPSYDGSMWTAGFTLYF